MTTVMLLPPVPGRGDNRTSYVCIVFSFHSVCRLFSPTYGIVAGLTDSFGSVRNVTFRKEGSEEVGDGTLAVKELRIGESRALTSGRPASRTIRMSRASSSPPRSSSTSEPRRNTHANAFRVDAHAVRA